MAHTSGLRRWQSHLQDSEEQRFEDESPKGGLNAGTKLLKIAIYPTNAPHSFHPKETYKSAGLPVERRVHFSQ
jgi:hypothetical protein